MTPAEVLTPEGWIRLLREQPLPNSHNVFYCPTCRTALIVGARDNLESRLCEVDGMPMVRWDDEFWSQLSRFLLRSYRKDRGLFARIKSEYPKWPFPKLEGPLAWLHEAWEKAGPPRGRPHHVAQRFFVARWMNALSGTTFVVNDREDGVPPFERREALMSQEKAIEVLERTWTAGRDDPQMKYGGLSSTALENLSAAFENEARNCFGEMPSLERREVQRTLTWVKRTQDDPPFRLILGSKKR
jgi:hypothetical protein